MNDVRLYGMSVDYNVMLFGQIKHGNSRLAEIEEKRKSMQQRIHHLDEQINAAAENQFRTTDRLEAAG